MLLVLQTTFAMPKYRSFNNYPALRDATIYGNELKNHIPNIQ